MAERDPALLPGPTAQQWDGRSRIALGCAVLVVPVALVAAAVGAETGLVFFLVFGGIMAAAFVAWIVLGQASLGRMRAEMLAGYSTTLDVAGYALRHPVTGALQRAADVEPLTPGPVRHSFLLDAFRLRG